MRYESPEFKGLKTSYDLVVDNQIVSRIDLQAPGEHNILNSLAAISIIFATVFNINFI